MLCWSRASKGKMNEINRLISRTIRCMHYKNLKENVKKMLNVENAESQMQISRDLTVLIENFYNLKLFFFEILFPTNEQFANLLGLFY